MKIPAALRRRSFHGFSHRITPRLFLTYFVARINARRIRAIRFVLCLLTIRRDVRAAGARARARACACVCVCAFAFLAARASV